jgi:hypothetical protein
MLPILFLCLCCSSLGRAQAGVTLLVKSGIRCDWKLDGQPMGMLRPDEPRVVLVSPGEHLIEASPSDGAAPIRTTVEVDKVEKTVDIGRKGQNDQQSKREHAEKPRGPAEDAAARNAIWTDPATQLLWTRKDNGSDVDWPQATAYCSKLQLAGYNGWRLPTNEELQGIYDLSVKDRKKFDDGMTYDVYVKAPLDLTGSDWSSSPGDELGRPDEGEWDFSFAGAPPYINGHTNPFKNFTHFSFNMRALCVRRAAE